MEKRGLVEFIIGCILILLGGIVTILPIFNINDVKTVFLSLIAIYGFVHLIKNLFIIKSKDFTGYLTTIASIGVLIISLFLDINDSPWNLALLLFIWIIIMSLIKLKESDYYHDRENKLWELNIVNLIIFIITGILTTINLYYTGDIQILIIGFFFLINGILEVIDPVVGNIVSKIKK